MKETLVISVILATLSGALGNLIAQCPMGWTHKPSSGQCYLVHSYGKERSFDDSRYYCQGHGGDLIKIESAEIRDWILAEIAGTGLVGQNSLMWAGAHSVDGIWQWIEDNNPINEAITPFDPASGVGDCAALTMNATLLKLDCGTRLHFVCHRAINTPPTCDYINGWEGLHDHCYKKSSRQDSWHDASIECEIDSGYLITISGDLEQQYATDFAIESHDQVWTGLTEEGHAGNFTWIQDTNITFQHWGEGQPDLSFNGYGGVVVDHNEADGRWIVERITENYHYLCKKKTGACVYGWEQYKDSCYFFNTEPSDVMVGYDSWKMCQKVGANLVIIDDEDEDVFYRSRIPETDTLWIGLYSPPSDSLYWVDGTPMSTNFTHMSDDDIALATASETELCVFESVDGTTGTSSWIPIDCTEPRHYACEIPVGQPVTLLPPSATRYCPENWLLNVDYCYMYGEKEVTWTQARSICQQDGGDLASITSWGEQDFIHNNQILGGSWIGLNDRAVEGTWKWSDNSGVLITNWNDGEPNGDQFSNENCVEIMIEAGKWNDLTCGSLRSFICKRRSSPTPIGPPSPTTTPPPDYTNCGWDWVENPVSGECYRLEMAEYSFADAELHCKEHGHGSDGSEIQLVSLTTAQESSFVKDMVYEQHLSATSVWIGMKNDVDGNRWLDGTPVTFFNYADGEPNSGGYTEPCIEMYTGNGEWNDAVCDKRIPFICEKKGPYYVPIQPPPPPSAQCPEGWEPYNNHCYYLSPDSVDWDTANNWCQNNLGSQLISILDADENAYVTYISQSIWANIWLGLHDDNFGNNWHWLDGSPLEYQNWIEGEPNNENGVEHCGEIRGIDYYGMWNDFPCNNVNRYICKITIKTCPAGFTYNNKKCYYTTTLQETWDVARQKCKEFGNEADLVSIHNDEENYYFGEILGHTSEATWIGLRYDNNSQIWSWSDGKPTDYFHWNGGEPNELQAEFCGEMIDYYGTETHSKWNNLRCNEARTYGCEYYPTHSTGCEENWTYFNNYCYYYSNYDYSYIATDFDSAEADCVSKGAHLASIHTPEENDFVFSLLSSDSYSVWVGITDYGNSGNIEWSDGTSISFTKWDVMWSYPFQYSPACAYLYPYSYNGQWYLDACVYYNFYVCKKAMEPIPINPVSNGCHEGDESYKGSCYNFPAESYSWHDAKITCEGNGAHLIAINDRYEGAFISAFLGELGTRVWIGLNGTVNGDGSVTFNWVTGEPVDFTNWDEFEPNPEHGTCVAASGDSATPGLWTVWNCADVFRFICEYDREGWNPNTPTPTEPPGVNCAVGWNHKGDRCYRVFHDPLPWGQAELFCGSYGGHLTSINSADEEKTIQSLPGVAQINATFMSVWTGLELGSDSGYHWTDGSAVDYINWADGQPSSQYERDTCGSANKNSFKLSLSNCNGYLPFICEAREGTMHTTMAPPTPPQVEVCDDFPSWYRFGDHCYKFISESEAEPQTWWTAHRKCRDEGGELASIHTVEENYWIESMLVSKSDKTFWIGGRSFKDSGYEWIDGSPFDFDNWYTGEPNDMLDQEDCIGIYAHRTGYWNDQNCAHLEGRICKRPYGETHAPPDTTPNPGGHCLEGWAHAGVKCLKFFGNQTSFDTARAACKALHENSDLISIHSAVEQAHMLAGLAIYNVDVWTGLRFDGEYVWVDQSKVTYTNWAPGEPNGGTSGELCAEAYRDTGMWNDVGCDYSKGYVCQMPQDPSITEHNPPKCSAPYDSYLSLYGACYKLIAEGKTWLEAEQTCQDEGAHLASASDISENALLWSLMDSMGYKNLWIGLNSLENNNVYKWTDGWPVFYTNWGKDQPTVNDTDYDCVMLRDMEGTWFNVECSRQAYYACKYKNGTVPTPDPPTTGHCADERWLDLGGGYCYLIVQEHKIWSDASTNCIQQKGNLVSIHSQSESDLIQKAIKYVDYPLWTGLIQMTEGFGWSDNTAMDFINWEDGEPNNDWEQCGEIYPDRGTWNDIDCASTRPSICKALKEQDIEHTNPTGLPPHTTTRRPLIGGKLSGGAIFGIVVAVLVLFAGVGFIGYSFIHKKKSGNATLSANEMKSNADKVNFDASFEGTDA